MEERDPSDHRKVVILGGDDSATLGCINGLRQFGFEGEITVIHESEENQLVRKDYFHKAFVNLNTVEKFREAKVDKNKKNTKKSKI